MPGNGINITVTRSVADGLLTKRSDVRVQLAERSGEPLMLVLVIPQRRSFDWSSHSQQFAASGKFLLAVAEQAVIANALSVSNRTR